MKMIATSLVLLALAGCAEAPPPARQLTAEQDADVAKRCAGGCAIVPAPMWAKILEALKGREI